MMYFISEGKEAIFICLDGYFSLLLTTLPPNFYFLKPSQLLAVKSFPPAQFIFASFFLTLLSTNNFDSSMFILSLFCTYLFILINLFRFILIFFVDIFHQRTHLALFGQLFSKNNECIIG